MLAAAVERVQATLSGAPAPLVLPPAWTSAVSAYLDELASWNLRTDLTAARSPEELVDLTIADAAVVAAFSGEEGDWVDVGSGAGAPGLILGILRPRARMVLVEPRDRRVAFLRSVIGKLELRQVRVERGRSDTLAGGRFDTAISRATLPPPEWLAEGARLSRRSVWVLLAREPAPHHDGLVPDVDVTYEWPLTSVSRRAVRFVHSHPGDPPR